MTTERIKAAQPTRMYPHNVFNCIFDLVGAADYKNISDVAAALYAAPYVYLLQTYKVCFLQSGRCCNFNCLQVASFIFSFLNSQVQQ